MGEIMETENKADIEPHTTVIGNLVMPDKFRFNAIANTPAAKEEVEEKLISVDQMFYQLEKDFRFSLIRNGLQSKAIALIHFLIYVIQVAEHQGWDRESIRARLPNTWRIHRYSSFVKYLQDWPKGYSGDFEAINMIVDRKEYASINTLGGTIGRYSLNSAIAQQHREKLKIQSETVRKICKKFNNPHIVSIGCGSSRDLEQVQDEIQASGAKIVLIDFDQDALNESKRRLSKIVDCLDIFYTNVRRLPKLFGGLKEKKGKFHLVYAGGLFDYLPTGIIQIILKRLSDNFMRKNGILMFTNIVSGNPFRPWIETMADWKLIERSKKEMKDLLALTNCKRQLLTKDPTGLTWIAKAFNKKLFIS